jgi:hypothetical protein
VTMTMKRRTWAAVCGTLVASAVLNVLLAVEYRRASRLADEAYEAWADVQRDRLRDVDEMTAKLEEVRARHREFKDLVERRLAGRGEGERR